MARCKLLGVLYWLSVKITQILEGKVKMLTFFFELPLEFWSPKKILTKFKTHHELNTFFFTPFNKDSVEVCTCGYCVTGSKALTCSNHQNPHSSDRVTPHRPRTHHPPKQPGPGCTHTSTAATLLLSKRPLSPRRRTETPHKDQRCRRVLPARLCLSGCAPCRWLRLPVPSVIPREPLCFSIPRCPSPEGMGQSPRLPLPIA